MDVKQKPPTEQSEKDRATAADALSPANLLTRGALKTAVLSPLSLFSLLPIPSAQDLLLSTLSLGPIPRHIAFVMDGNRRWATTSGTSIREGHLSGFATLKRVLQVCLGLSGLDTVTVYAFAIDNFKRKKSEVDALMEIARTRLLELAGHGEIIARYEVRVRIVGRRELLPPDVREAVEKVENMTRSHRRATLNICMPYASRDEIAGAVRKCVDKRLASVQRAASSTDRVDPHLDVHVSTQALDEAMQLAHSPPLDILVRTSGVSRLSDFMLWQCNENTHLHFVDKYWPQFGMADMVPIILDWQRHHMARHVERWCGWSSQK